MYRLQTNFANHDVNSLDFSSDSWLLSPNCGCFPGELLNTNKNKCKKNQSNVEPQLITNAASVAKKLLHFTYLLVIYERSNRPRFSPNDCSFWRQLWWVLWNSGSLCWWSELSRKTVRWLRLLFVYFEIRVA
jgi:hypothetical protein